jgi:hypothetical protein
MRLRFLAITMLLVLSAAVYAAADATISSSTTPYPMPNLGGNYINFDTLPDGTPAQTGNQVGATDYAAAGVTINSLDGNALYYTPGGISQPNSIAESNANYLLNTQFVFGTGMNQVGLGIGNGDVATNFQFFDANNNLIGQVNNVQPGDSPVDGSPNYYITFTDNGDLAISSMVVTSSTPYDPNSGNGGNFVDDLQTVERVPEPSIISLLGTGLVGLFGVFRKKLAL